VSQFLSFIPSWTALRLVGNSMPAKLSILMPLVGYLIFFNEYVSRIIHFTNIDGGAVPPSLISLAGKLYFLYFGLFLAGVASAIFQLRCHGIVKRYSDEDDFVLRAESTITRRDLKEFLDVIERSSALGDRRPSLNLARQQFESLAGITASSQERSLQIDVMKMYYFVLANGQPYSRAATISLYSIAFFFLSIPSVDTFIRVARYMLHA
jgi:hypothetical protein